MPGEKKRDVTLMPRRSTERPVFSKKHYGLVAIAVRNMRRWLTPQQQLIVAEEMANLFEADGNRNFNRKEFIERAVPSK